MANRLPSMRLHKPSGNAVVTINGKDYYLGRFYAPDGTKNRAAVKKYNRLISEYSATNRSAAFGKGRNDLSVTELLAGYKAHLKETYGANFKAQFYKYRSLFRATRSLYGQTNAIEFGILEFKTVRHRLVEEGKASRKYINGQMYKLTKVFQWAAGEDLLPHKIYRKQRAVSPLKVGQVALKERTRVLPVEQSEIDAALPHMSVVVQAMVKFQRLVGCRPNEILNLTPSMIDRRGKVWTVDLQMHKNAHRGKKLRLHIGPIAQGIITPFLFREPDKPLFSPIESVEDMRARRLAKRKTPLSCGNSRGTKQTVSPKRPPKDRFTTASYRRAIERACEVAGIPKWSPNRLRHTRATELRKVGGLEIAGAVLNHSNLDTTLIYAEKSQEIAQDAALKWG